MPYLRKKYFREDDETIFENMLKLDTYDIFEINNKLLKNGYRTSSVDEKRTLLEEELKKYLTLKITKARKFISEWELRNFNVADLVTLYRNIFMGYSKIDSFYMEIFKTNIDNMIYFLLQKICELQERYCELTWVNDETDNAYEKHPELCIKKMF